MREPLDLKPKNFNRKKLAAFLSAVSLYSKN